MICPECKKVYSDDNVFCISCGTRLEEDSSNKGTPIERFSNRVKTSKPNEVYYQNKSKNVVKEFNSTNQKLDEIIAQNKMLIKQNKKIIELFERLAD